MNKDSSACFLVPAPASGVSNWVSGAVHLGMVPHSFIGFMFYCGGTGWRGKNNQKEFEPE